MPIDTSCDAPAKRPVKLITTHDMTLPTYRSMRTLVIDVNVCPLDTRKRLELLLKRVAYVVRNTQRKL